MKLYWSMLMKISMETLKSEFSSMFLLTPCLRELFLVLLCRQVVKAFVVLSSHFTGDKDMLVKELQDHVKETTAPYKYPRKVRHAIACKAQANETIDYQKLSKHCDRSQLVSS